MSLGKCPCGVDLDELKASGKFGHACGWHRIALTWSCAICRATQESKRSCRVIYVHGDDDAVVCERCDLGAEVVDDRVRRALMREKLERSILIEYADGTVAERAYRKGHNAAIRSVLEMLS